jgi:cation diffusion facilitator CzcD-associated flavoprotein CzcO
MDDATYEARHVVLATGPYQRARIPAFAANLPASIKQVHAGDYRNPGQLPAGAVLVVGSGASGCQIADELIDAGRRVYPAVGRHRRAPRRYRGRDLFWWRREIGELDGLADSGVKMEVPLMTGVRGGYDVDIRSCARRGATILGHIRAASDGRLEVAPDLEASLADGDRKFREFTRARSTNTSPGRASRSARRTRSSLRLTRLRNSSGWTCARPASRACSGPRATISNSAGWTCRCSVPRTRQSIAAG